MDVNTGATYAPMTALVTTRDGKCPDGHIEVETRLEAPMLRDLLARTERNKEYWERAHATLMHVELELRHCIRQLIQVIGKPIDRGSLRDHLYALDLVTPQGELYVPTTDNRTTYKAI
jgi:hypothetical protein